MESGLAAGEWAAVTVAVVEPRERMAVAVTIATVAAIKVEVVVGPGCFAS